MQYICILDFEATCWNGSDNHEIIEFPSVMLKWDDDIAEVGRIQIYVKPKTNPIVSEFCETLTGITQEVVDGGVDLKTAIKTHTQWMLEFAPLSQITIVTCGNWDLKTMLPMDLKNIGLKVDSIYSKWINIKAIFTDITKKNGCPMTGMLKYFNLDIEGRHHSGIDDCHNIARIFVKLVEYGLTKKICSAHIQTIKN